MIHLVVIKLITRARVPTKINQKSLSSPRCLSIDASLHSKRPAPVVVCNNNYRCKTVSKKFFSQPALTANSHNNSLTPTLASSDHSSLLSHTPTPTHALTHTRTSLISHSHSNSHLLTTYFSTLHSCSHFPIFFSRLGPCRADVLTRNTRASPQHHNFRSFLAATLTGRNTAQTNDTHVWSRTHAAVNSITVNSEGCDNR